MRSRTELASVIRDATQEGLRKGKPNEYLVANVAKKYGLREKTLKRILCI